MVLITLPVTSIGQYGAIRYELEILPDGIPDQPGKGVVPVQNDERLSQKDIDGVSLPDMYIFMEDDLLPLLFRVLLWIRVDTISKRERRYFFIDAINLYFPFVQQYGLLPDSPELEPADEEPYQHKTRACGESDQQIVPWAEV